MTLEEAIKRYIDNAEYERTHGNLQGCLDFKQLAEWLKELREQTRWIPVSERLPQKNGHYLCTVTRPQYIDRIYVRLNYWCDRWYGCSRGEVVAWMPLPEQYKAESKEK